MKLILPENLKNEKAVYIISIYRDMLIVASENKFKPELILQSTDLPQKETKNAFIKYEKNKRNRLVGKIKRINKK